MTCASQYTDALTPQLLGRFSSLLVYNGNMQQGLVRSIGNTPFTSGDRQPPGNLAGFSYARDHYFRYSCPL